MQFWKWSFIKDWYLTQVVLDAQAHDSFLPQINYDWGPYRVISLKKNRVKILLTVSFCGLYIQIQLCQNPKEKTLRIWFGGKLNVITL
jgi:hypothetical protein